MLEVAYRGMDRGTIRLLGFVDGSDLVDEDGNAEEGYGLSLSWDYALTDDFTAFGRLGYRGFNDSVYTTDWAASVGGRLMGTSWGRDADEFAFALGVINPDDDNPVARGLMAKEEEFTSEIYYKYVVNNNVYLKPDIQIIHNQGGRDDLEDNTIVVYGLHLHIGF
jgi:carbohydrate-selective porin OprB